MSTERLEKQVETLQSQLDESDAEIERLKGIQASTTSRQDIEDMEVELQDIQDKVKYAETTLENLTPYAEQAKHASDYAKDYCLGAYIAKCTSEGMSEIDIESSLEYVEFYRDLEEREVTSGDDFLNIMREGAGYYRTARNLRARHPEKTYYRKTDVRPPDDKRIPRSPFRGSMMRNVSA